MRRLILLGALVALASLPTASADIFQNAQATACAQAIGSPDAVCSAHDDRRVLCGAWDGDAPTVGCGYFRFSFGTPACSGTGRDYACTVPMIANIAAEGPVSVAMRVDAFGFGLATSGGPLPNPPAQSGPGAWPFTDIPAGGEDLVVKVNACAGVPGSDPFTPDPARETCDAWTRGVLHLPGPP